MELPYMVFIQTHYTFCRLLMVWSFQTTGDKKIVNKQKIILQFIFPVTKMEISVSMAFVFFFCPFYKNKSAKCVNFFIIFSYSNNQLSLRLSTLGKNNSADDILLFFIYLFFLFSPQNRFWHFMQCQNPFSGKTEKHIGNNLHEMSKPVFWDN